MGEVKDQDGTLDLEKELSCSICTDVLFQPLTLLDCLHTFCGSCLKEWFSWQAQAKAHARARDGLSHSSSDYTCPACRAVVRDTKANATVTTLLEMFLKAHPERGKSQEEKDQSEKTYKPGDNVIPPLPSVPDADSDASEDERLLAEVRELSLAHLNVNLQGPPTSSHRAVRHGSNPPRIEPSSVRQRRRHRGHLDHQSSLRSILSASTSTSTSISEPDSLDMQQEIMHQIMDEGLLDGIDLDDLTPEQEEHITERIAHAFQTLQREREQDHLGVRDRQNERERDRSTNSSQTNRSPRQSSLADIEHRNQSRSSLYSESQARSHSRPRHRSQHQYSSDQQHSRDLSQTSSSSNQTYLLPLNHLRSTSAAGASRSSHQTFNDRNQDHSAPVRSYSGHDQLYPYSHGTARSSIFTGQSRFNVSLPIRPSSNPANNSSPALLSPETLSMLSGEDHRPATASLVPSPLIASVATASVKPGPVSCSACAKPDIQRQLHWRCIQCSSGAYYLCTTCYRAGKGCNYWFGFGYAAHARYRSLHPPGIQSADHARPHILIARRFREDTGALEEGLFCDGCFAFADDCYWHCDTCNDGAWGFCNLCVQQACHCTHPLQCLRRISDITRHIHPIDAPSQGDSADHDLHPLPLHTTKSSFNAVSHPSALSSSNLPNVPDPSLYTTLTLAVYCDICQRSIPPSHTRYHCHVCNSGNYDICSSCYNAAERSGKMKPQDGTQGWRRCPRGHRMSVVGFEDREGGPRRVVVKDFVGGWALKEDESQMFGSNKYTSLPVGEWSWREEDGTSASRLPTTRHQIATDLIPPDGGVGMKTRALWCHFPSEEAQDELAFPRHAIITEVEDINGDWYWGVYAGKKGLFSGNYVQIV